MGTTPISADTAAATRFLAALFETGADAGMYFYTWGLPSKHSAWWRCEDAALAAAAACERASAGENLYMGLGLARCAYGPSDRLSSKADAIARGAPAVEAIPGLWADVDVAGPGHKAKQYPPSTAEAEKLVRGLGPEPSMIVHSGFGLHAYWLFKEALLVPDAAARAMAENASRRWSATLRAWAARSGWKVDSVYDLARVLRVAGTLNHKGDPPAAVRVLAESGRRYELSDLDQYMVAEETVSDDPRSRLAVAPVVLAAAAEPPVEKFVALLENSTKFRATWETRRRDLEDPSPSGYDLSIAVQAAAAGWSDQEIVDLIIARRRRAGAEPKMRVDYMQRTLTKARAGKAVDRALEALTSETNPIVAPTVQAIAVERPPPADAVGGAAPMVRAAPASPELDAARAAVLENVSELFGVRVVRWIRDGGREALHIMVLAGGAQVEIGPAASVVSQGAFRSALYNATGVAFRPIKQHLWFKICSRLGQIVEIVANDQDSVEAQMTEWLRMYLPGQVNPRDDEAHSALSGSLPFVKQGRQHVHAQHLQRHLKVELGVVVDKKEIWRGLRALGFTSGTVTGRGGDGKVRARSYWSIDEAALDAALGPQAIGPKKGAP